MKNEQWRPVVGYEGLYEVSNKGRVKSLARTVKTKNGHDLKVMGRILAQTSVRTTKRHPSVRYVVGLWKNNKNKTAKVARLVGIAFVKNPHNKPHINHKDGIATNDNAENLEWVTAQENNVHARKNGLIKSDALKKRVKGVHHTTGEELCFESLTSAAEHFDVTKTAINACIHGYGRAKRCKGFSWKYLD